MASLLSYALTTVADVKESLGVTDSSLDNLIIRKINQATRQIEKYCDRHFLASSYVEEYNATQTNQLVLKQRPVISFSSLEIRDSGLNYNSWETVDSQIYFVDNESGVVSTLYRNSGGFNRYRATYTAGYSTIPEDLAEACASLACYYVNNADGSDVGVARKKEGARELQYANSSLSFDTILQNLGIDATLDAYSNPPVMTNR